MAALDKVRVQLLDEETGAVIKEVDVQTSADAVTFADGETFQQKLDSGKLKGDTGAQGPQGKQGIQGIQGPKGESGENVKYGTDYASGTTAKLFFKVIS